MSRPTVSKRKLAQLQALGHAGLAPGEYIPALLEALHAVIPSARNLLDWTDAGGRLLRYDIEGPVDTRIAEIYFEHFHNRLEGDCMPVFASLMRSPAGVRAAAPLMTHEFFNSALYHEVWKPQQLHSRIEGVVRGVRGQLLGSLVLYRGPTDPAFQPDDEQALAALLPSVARGLEWLRPASNDERFRPAPEGAETLLLRPDGELLHASAGALRLLLLADDGLSPAAFAQLQQRLPGQLRRLFGRLLEALRERPQPALSARSMTLVNAHGCFTVEASRLEPLHGAAAEGLLQISLRRMEPEVVALHRALRHLPLSPTQLRVCAGLYRGCPMATLGRELGVAASTVTDHVRKAYRALDVRDAAALRRLLERQMLMTGSFSEAGVRRA